MQGMNEFLDDLKRNGLTIVPKDEVKRKKSGKKKSKKSKKSVKMTEEPAVVDDFDDDEEDSEGPTSVEEGTEEKEDGLPHRAVWSMAYNSIDIHNTAIYDEKEERYFINGTPFKEGEKAFIALRRGIEFGCNLDTDYPGGSQFTPILLPADCAVFFDPERYDGEGEYHAPLLFDEKFDFRDPSPVEKDLIFALEHAVNYPAPGFFVFCRDGKFNVLCAGHHNAADFDVDTLICIFNARSCTDGYRKSWLDAIAQADSVMIGAELRFSPTEHWFWPDAIIEDLVDEVESAKPGGCWSPDGSDDDE